jgi:acetyltransferase-like isoleucine patch superfamily enzyme
MNMSFIFSRVFWLLAGYWVVWRSRLEAEGRLRIIGFPVIKNKGKIIIGAGVDLRSSPSSTAMGVITPVILNTMTTDSTIRIGNSVGMSGVIVCAKNAVTIGERVKLGSGVVLSDTDFHSLDWRERRTENDFGGAADAPVRIGDDCFIGARAMVLKGVSIGARSIVGAGAVVVEDVPEDSVVAGNPARVIRSLV